MAQTTENNISAAAGSTLSGIIAALKGGFSGSTAGGNLFSNLLAETETALPKVEANDPSLNNVAQTADTQRKSTNASYDSARREDNRDLDRQAAQAETAVNASDRKSACTQKAKAKKEEDNKPPQEAKAASEEGKASNTVDQEAKDVETKAEGTEEKQVVVDGEPKQEDDQDEEEIASLLAALVPLADMTTKANVGEDAKIEEKTGTKGEDSQTTGGQAMALTAMDQNAANQVLKMNAMKQQADNAAQRKGKKLTEEGEVEAGAQAQQAQSQPLLAGAEKSALKDLTLTETKADGEQPTNLYSKMVDANTDNAQGGATNADAQNTGRAFEQLLNHGANAPQNPVAPIASGVAGQTSQTTTQPSDSSSSATQSVGGVKSTSTQLPAGDGVRSVGSYDFASQLSAARVTKGGAVGLPQAVEQVSIQLNKAAKDGIDEITIQLRPAELGRIEIKLEFGADKNVTGTVVADNQATLNMLQKDSDSLQRALQEAGLQADAGCMQFSLRNENGANQFGQQQGTGANTSLIANDNARTDLEIKELASTETYYLTPGRVNLHV